MTDRTMRAMDIVTGLMGLVGGELVLNVTVPLTAGLIETVGGLAVAATVGFLGLGIFGVFVGTQCLLDGLFPYKRAAKAKSGQ